jgi:hypothetical protein
MRPGSGHPRMLCHIRRTLFDTRRRPSPRRFSPCLKGSLAGRPYLARERAAYAGLPFHCDSCPHPRRLNRPASVADFVASCAVGCFSVGRSTNAERPRGAFPCSGVGRRQYQANAPPRVPPTDRRSVQEPSRTRRMSVRDGNGLGRRVRRRSSRLVQIR